MDSNGDTRNPFGRTLHGPMEAAKHPVNDRREDDEAHHGDQLLDIPLPGASLVMRALFILLRFTLLGGRALVHAPLVVLPHDRVTRLVTVFLLLKLLLPLHLLGIPIP